MTIEESFSIAIEILNALEYEQMSKAELSKKTGFSMETIDDMVKGKHCFSLEEVEKLELGLGIQLIEHGDEG